MQAPRIIALDPALPNREALRAIADALAAGEPVIVPTETVYGLACRPDIDGAVEKIYAIKGRPENKPLPRMVPDADVVRRLVSHWPEQANLLAHKWWPGPLTMILQAGDGTLGFRIPDHPVMLALLRECGVPLAVTSANPSGAREAHSAQEALDMLEGRVALAIDSGPVRFAQPSTVVDLTGREIRILREGAIPSADIIAALNLANP